MEIFFGFVGGLAIFIYAMQSMADGLQKTAGDKARRVLEVLTGVPVVGVIMGAFVTSSIQSSSATTVMVISFVNAGLMTLKQAVSVLMGANIGTTITAQLISFKLTNYIFPIIFIGFLLHFLGRKKRAKYVGQVIFSFGLLLLGLGLMQTAMAPLKDYPQFVGAIQQLSKYPLLGVLVGIVTTALVQSSSATIAILIALASQGLIPIEAAIPVLLGDNIGTCVTALLASIGANLSAKRAAAAHVIFNVVGTIIVLILMPLFMQFVMLVSPPDLVARQIANAHTSFNVINTLIFLPLINLFVKVIIRVVPGSEEVITSTGPVYLDDRMLKAPTLALALATKEIIRMANLARDNVSMAMEGFFKGDNAILDEVIKNEEIIDQLEKDITFYLSKISQKSLTSASSRRHTGLLHAINDIERVGDHAENISQLARIKINERLPISEFALEELEKMTKLSLEAYTTAIRALEDDSMTLAGRAVELESEVDTMERALRKNHIRRLNSGKCHAGSGVVFLDIISNLERISDHSHNIAEVVLGEL
ncbi:Na/Pi cotransporter family protein [Desulfitibacter alkalitolerans]|uniref:Na/Pi cotransporter family protein n=1 Tax=Desulfitibacter alkalitolerans TaxID=264641 RepID=UPI0004820B5F|nr:Na/Pi cotransporter family protein [Desulfitibacter alkalitolerans]